MLTLRLLEQNLGPAEFVQVRQACGPGRLTYRLLLSSPPTSARAVLRFAVEGTTKGGPVGPETIVVAPVKDTCARLEQGTSGWELVVEEDIPSQDRWSVHRQTRGIDVKIRLEGPGHLKCLLRLELVVSAPVPPAMLVKTRLLVLFLVGGLFILAPGALLVWWGMEDLGTFQVTWSLPEKETCEALEGHLSDTPMEYAPEGALFRMWTTDRYDQKTAAEVQNKVEEGLDKIKEKGHDLGRMGDHTPRCLPLGIRWSTAGPGAVMVLLGIMALALSFGHITEIRGHRP